MASTRFYNNIPPTESTNSSDNTLKFFDQFYQVPIELNDTSLTATRGFFESRGFAKSAAETIAVVILTQAKRDKLNEFNILDTLEGLNDLQLSSLVGEILNFNRFKTSNLGLAPEYLPTSEIQRNIIV
jgi:hypothetical protein